MKNIVLSAVAVLAMSSFAVAGGDITPVEEPIVVPEPVMESDAGFYLGLGYGWQEALLEDTFAVTDDIDKNFGSIMIDAGYKFNKYVAVEARYWFGLSSSNDLGWYHQINSDITIDSWGLYVKPMYPVTDAFDIYALLGYGSTSVDVDAGDYRYDIGDADGFSWGIGMEYAATSNIGLFIDYTYLVNTEPVSVTIDDINYPLGVDESVANINFGVNYHF